MLIQIIGYAGSVLVAASLLMTSILWLRLINLLGAVFFVVYAVVIGSIPVVLTNGFIVAVNIYYLSRIMRANTSGFSYVPVGPNSWGSFSDFIDQYKNDIQKFWPVFTPGVTEMIRAGTGKAYLALRNLRVDGFACYLPCSDLDSSVLPREIVDYIHRELYPDQSVLIPADYITAKYRGLGLVTKLYNRLLDDLPSKISFLIVVTRSESRSTRRFLSRNGHIPQGTFGEFALLVKTLR
jgi:hypothetical protein